MEKLQKLTIAIILGIVALGFQSCGSDDNEPKTDTSFTLSENKVSLKKGDVIEVKINGNHEKSSLSVEDGFYANAYIRDNLITIQAQYVGRTIVRVSNGMTEKGLEVTVEPQYKSVASPYLGWGKDESEVEANVSNISERGTNYQGYTYIKCVGRAPIWSDETYYFDNHKLIAVHSDVREVFNDVATPILILGERFKTTSKSFSGYNHYDWFEKPGETRVRLCTARYGSNKYDIDIVYAQSDAMIENISSQY